MRNSSPEWVLGCRGRFWVKARDCIFDYMSWEVLEVAERCLKVGLEARGVGIKESELGKVLEEGRAMVLQPV